MAEVLSLARQKQPVAESLLDRAASTIRLGGVMYVGTSAAEELRATAIDLCRLADNLSRKFGEFPDPFKRPASRRMHHSLCRRFVPL